jgi:predicted transcriptional regulator
VGHRDALTKEQREANAPDRRILRAVSEQPGLGVRELATAAKVGFGETSHLVRTMVAEGKLVAQKEGKRKAVYPGPHFPSPEPGPEGGGDA